MKVERLNDLEIGGFYIKATDFGYMRQGRMFLVTEKQVNRISVLKLVLSSERGFLPDHLNQNDNNNYFIKIGGIE